MWVFAMRSGEEAGKGRCDQHAELSNSCRRKQRKYQYDANEVRPGFASDDEIPYKFIYEQSTVEAGISIKRYWLMVRTRKALWGAGKAC